MSVSGNKPLRAEPNVTPMIDVMLVLLIIFMVVTPALLNGTAVNPPSAANLHAHPDDPGDHTLTIGLDGQFYLDRLPVPEGTLGPRIAALYVARKDRVLFVRADKDLEYSVVLDALNVVHENGVAVVGMIADPVRAP